jgi:short subunit dehydrogenase-like uncharacterized protein
MANCLPDSGFKWAICGRDQAKLSNVLSERVPKDVLSSPEIILADVNDIESLILAFRRAKVVIKYKIRPSNVIITYLNIYFSCVGPYRYYGEAVVQACISSHADYVDITGEPEFVEKMFAKYDEAAKEKQVAIVNCCGFDSIPADLGNLFIKKQFFARGCTASVKFIFYLYIPQLYKK